MNRRLNGLAIATWGAVFSIAVALAPAPRAQAQATAPTGPAARLPAPVWAAFHAGHPSAVVKGVSREREDGKTVWEVECTEQGRNMDITYFADGSLAVLEESVPAADVPAAVTAALKAKYPKATVSLWERVTRDRMVEYEAHLKSGGPGELVFTPDGQLVSPKK